MEFLNPAAFESFLVRRTQAVSLEMLEETTSWAGCKTVGVPSDVGRRTVLGTKLVNLYSAEREFVMEIHEHGIWETLENWDLFNGYRASLGNKNRLAKGEGMLFGEAEDLIKFRSFVTLVLYFCWGARIYGFSNRVLTTISHDEVIDLRAINSEQLSSLVGSVA